jgi:hypothetical protein
MSTAVPLAERGFASSPAFGGGFTDGRRTGGGTTGGSEPEAPLTGAGGSGLFDGRAGALIAGRDGWRDRGGTTGGREPVLTEGGIGGGSDPGLVPFANRGGGSDAGPVPFCVTAGGGSDGGGSDGGGSDGGGSDTGPVPFGGTGGGSDPGLVPFDSTGGGSDDGPAPFCVTGGGSGDGTPLGSVAAWFGGGGTAAPTRVRDRAGGEGGTRAVLVAGDFFFASPSNTSRSLPPLLSAMVENSSGYAAPFAAASRKRKRSRMVRATSVSSMYKRSSRASSERARIP